MPTLTVEIPEIVARRLEAAMQQRDPEREKTLERCSAELQENSTLLEKRLFAFVRNNQAGIRI